MWPDILCGREQILDRRQVNLMCLVCCIKPHGLQVNRFLFTTFISNSLSPHPFSSSCFLQIPHSLTPLSLISKPFSIQVVMMVSVYYKVLNSDLHLLKLRRNEEWSKKKKKDPLFLFAWQHAWAVWNIVAQHSQRPLAKWQSGMFCFISPVNPEPSASSWFKGLIPNAMEPWAWAAT